MRCANNLKDWLDQCNSHSCESKIFSLYDNSEKLMIGHQCKCGCIFEIRVTKDVMKDSTGFSEEEFKKIKYALSTPDGRVALMVSCFDPKKLLE